MSNHTSLASMLQPPVWTTSINLQDAYFHILIRPSLHKFLAFMHEEHLYFFKALPFGLNVAPYIFTRLLRYPLGVLHRSGIPVIAYLDDWMIWGKSQTDAARAFNTTLQYIQKLGFIVNMEKSQAIPSTDTEWLGVRWLSATGRWGLPLTKQINLKISITDLLHRNTCSRREWESQLRGLNFLSQILSHTRHLIQPLLRLQLLNSASHRDMQVLIPDLFKQDLRPWLDLPLLEQTEVFCPVSSPLLLWTDTSTTGWGGHTETLNTSGTWTAQEQLLHINILEVRAVCLTILQLNIRSHLIHLFIDNAPAQYAIKRLSAKVSESPPRNILTHPHPEAERDQDPTLQNFHSPEQQSGQPQPILHAPPRVGAPTTSIQLHHSTVGLPGDRSHGDSQERQAPNLPISPSRPSSPRLQLPSLGLESVATNLPIPTQVVHPDGDNQTPIVQTPRHHHPPVVPSGDMVSIHQELGPPMVAPGPTRSHEECMARLREVDRIKFLKECFAFTLGDQVASPLVQAYRGSTNRQAESIWKTFQNWLPADVTSVTPRTVMEFLLALEARHLNLNPRTILNYRSQLRLPILQAFGLDLSSDLFSLLARSQFLKNPPSKKKVPQWCMDKVLATFSSEEFNMNTASPTNLLLKTIFLTALASGNRASELAATIREGLIISKDKAVLPTSPDFLLKNQNSQHPRPPDITFPALGRRHSLCPVNPFNTVTPMWAS
ncbi:uncharacterized protein LOC123499522 isoform X1 [Portunus trituberculatus]|uniref:uncharacterized protein LOC123499522 isoform X1 n=1 Tax=Portunus trituberculatus TaxID=210409 RepID=UPI001E1CB69A|nr:uncharacterized protein LOC123499522 isoform X1 [Portunus trituberculatus]